MPKKPLDAARKWLTSELVTPVEMEIFTCIGRSRTLSEAARSLGLQLSTVSRALKRLERIARLPLVKRDHHGLELTGPGQDYLVACEAVLRANRAATEVLRLHRKDSSGTLLIGAPIAFIRHVLTPLLPKFLEQHPKLFVRLDPYCSGWNQEPRAIHDIFIKVRAPLDSGLHLRFFPAIRQGLYASPAYLARHGTPAVPEDLKFHHCVQDWSDGSGTTWKLQRDLERRSINPKFRTEIADPDTLCDLAALSVGITPLAQWRAQAQVESGELVRVLPEWEPEPVMTCVLYAGKAKSASKENAFVSLLGECLGTRHDPRILGRDPHDFFVIPK
jgi:DNA-binding transcriptional LysR family regulator